jgi:hypothetical protein
MAAIAITTTNILSQIIEFVDKNVADNGLVDDDKIDR